MEYLIKKDSDHILVSPFDLFNLIVSSVYYENKSRTHNFCLLTIYFTFEYSIL